QHHSPLVSRKGVNHGLAAENPIMIRRKEKTREQGGHGAEQGTKKGQRKTDRIFRKVKCFRAETLGSS
ncbi:hypothetical protein PS002_23170, partial [Shigella sonnei]|nr:hypothetical protein [Shigella sonnei]